MLRGVKIGLFILIVLCVTTAFAYSKLPERMAVHWNTSGKPNDYAPKQTACIVMPAIILLLLGLFEIIPRIDPLGKNIREFLNIYNQMVVILILFLSMIHAAILLWNLGFEFSISSAVLIGVGLILIYFGTVMPKMKPNWFVGIRTPWTLSNSRVWKKTHEFGGKLFIIAGIIVIAASLLIPVQGTEQIVWIVVLSAIIPSFILIIYSYLEWRKGINSV